MCTLAVKGTSSRMTSAFVVYLRSIILGEAVNLDFEIFFINN